MDDEGGSKTQALPGSSKPGGAKDEKKSKPRRRGNGLRNARARIAALEAHLEQVQAKLAQTDTENGHALHVDVKVPKSVCYKPGVIEWLVDSGASHHMTNEPCLTDYKSLPTPRIISGAGNSRIEGIGVGTAVGVAYDVHGHLVPLKLENVLYAPNLGYSLMSVPAAALQHEAVTTCGPKCAKIKTRAGAHLQAPLINRAYRLWFRSTLSEARIAHSRAAHAPPQIPETADLWHRRLGHIHEKQILDTAA